MTAVTPSRADIDLLVTDFDGVLTDNRVSVSEDGRESVVCSRADGTGCDLLRAAGLPVLILSTERNPVVSARGAKMRVEVVQDCPDKGAALRELVAARGLDPARVMYVGNDVNDAGALAVAGWPVVPADAHPAVAGLARHATRARGGEGVLRELADTLLGGAASGGPAAEVNG
jgi:YrbI family 3-deoxy-D-manno-octulosonate 8-phosphate phosphatase